MHGCRVLFTLIVCFVAGAAVEATDLGTAGGDINVDPQSLHFAVPIDGLDAGELVLRNDAPLAFSWFIQLTEPAASQVRTWGARAQTSNTPVTDSFATLAGGIFRGTGPSTACENPTGVSWLSVNPTDGILTPGEAASTTVSVDATGLAIGDYEALACVFVGSEPQVEVPVTLSVVEGALQFTPEILVFQKVPVGTQSPPQVTTLSNIGTGDATGISFSTPGNGFAVDTGDCGTMLAPRSRTSKRTFRMPEITLPARIPTRCSTRQSSGVMIAAITTRSRL